MRKEVRREGRIVNVSEREREGAGEETVKRDGKRERD